MDDCDAFIGLEKGHGNNENNGQPNHWPYFGGGISSPRKTPGHDGNTLSRNRRKKERERERKGREIYRKP